MIKKLALCLILGASIAHAEQIPLRDGTLTFESISSGGGPVYLQGRNFDFEGYASSAYLNAMDCWFGCDTGETVDVGMRVAGGDLPGVATYRGVEHVDVGGFSSTDNLALEIMGTMRVPGHQVGEHFKTRAAKCKVTGQFYHDNEIENLVGSANAMVTFVWMDGFGWVVDKIIYDIKRR